MWTRSEVDASSFPKALHACLSPLLKNKDSITLSKNMFITKCVMPYVTGAWTNTHWLLRTPQMVNQAANDKLLIPEKGEKRHHVFYPYALPAMKKIILKNSHDASQLLVTPLPAV